MSLGDTEQKPQVGIKHCLSEIKNNVYVAKVTNFSHKKCMIWHLLINVSKMQLLSCLCCKFHFPAMISQIPLYMHVSFICFQNELNHRDMARAFSHSPWEIIHCFNPEDYTVWWLLTIFSLPYELSLMMIPKSQNCWWQMILKVM